MLADVDIRKEDANRAISNFIIFLAIAIIFILSILPIPSVYVYEDVSDQKFDKVKDIITNSLHKVDADRIDLLSDCMDIFYARILHKLRFYKWLILGFFTIFPLIGRLKLWILSGSPQTVKHDIASEIVEGYLTSGVVILGIFLFINCYKRGVDIVFKTIKFSCIDIKDDLLKSAIDKN